MILPTDGATTKTILIAPRKLAQGQAQAQAVVRHLIRESTGSGCGEKVVVDAADPGRHRDLDLRRIELPVGDIQGDFAAHLVEELALERGLPNDVHDCDFRVVPLRTEDVDGPRTGRVHGEFGDRPGFGVRPHEQMVGAAAGAFHAVPDDRAGDEAQRPQGLPLRQGRRRVAALAIGFFEEEGAGDEGSGQPDPIEHFGQEAGSDPVEHVEEHGQEIAEIRVGRVCGTDMVLDGQIAVVEACLVEDFDQPRGQLQKRSQTGVCERSGDLLDGTHPGLAPGLRDAQDLDDESDRGRDAVAVVHHLDGSRERGKPDVPAPVVGQDHVPAGIAGNVREHVLEPRSSFSLGQRRLDPTQQPVDVVGRTGDLGFAILNLHEFEAGIRLLPHARQRGEEHLVQLHFGRRRLAAPFLDDADRQPCPGFCIFGTSAAAPVAGRVASRCAHSFTSVEPSSAGTGAT